MIKKPIAGNKIFLEELEKREDVLAHYILDKGPFKAMVLDATCLCNQMRANHELGILESYILSQSYMAALLMAGNLKGEDRLSYSIECGGPAAGLNVEANSQLQVRGYLKNNTIPVEKPLASFDTSSFFGPGFLSVSRYTGQESRPFTGQVMLMYGNIAEDTAYYYLTSEQTPTLLQLSVKFDDLGLIQSAGGLLIQALPEAGEEHLIRMEEMADKLPSLGKWFMETKNPDSFMEQVFSSFNPRLLEKRLPSFACACSEKSFGQYLGNLPENEKTGILSDGPFPLETNCYNCNTTYSFSREALSDLFS